MGLFQNRFLRMEPSGSVKILQVVPALEPDFQLLFGKPGKWDPNRNFEIGSGWKLMDSLSGSSPGSANPTL